MFKFNIKTLNVKGCPRGLTAQVLDSGFEESEFELQFRYYVHFQTNTLGKGSTFQAPSLNTIVAFSSRRMSLALNNPRSLICLMNKETLDIYLFVSVWLLSLMAYQSSWFPSVPAVEKANYTSTVGEEASS